MNDELKALASMLGAAQAATSETPIVDLFDLERHLSAAPTPQLALRLMESCDWSKMHGPADLFFNHATQASRYRHRTLAAVIQDRGLELYPDNVDLLCDRFQNEYVYWPERAEATLARIEQVPERMKYWRYWVFRAMRLIILGELDQAVDVLHEATAHVPFNHLSNVYNLLVHPSMPRVVTWGGEQTRVSVILESALEQGLHEGHVLALGLSQLARRGASRSDEVQTERLEEALRWNEVALALYVDESSNHPLEDILYPRASILMALRRHGEAKPILQSIYTQRMAHTTQVRTMLAYCSAMVGEAFSPEGEEG